jgi:uncharacterized membrane protein YGL010W
MECGVLTDKATHLSYLCWRPQRSWDEWIAEYSRAHQNQVNKRLHLIGIPTVVVSLILLGLSPFLRGLWQWALALFIIGWTFQFVGHAFEGKPPEFFKDWRYLLVGLRWWFAKLSGKTP